MKRTEANADAKQGGEPAAQLISKRIAELGDWRGEMLGRIRALIKDAEPDILEEWKWRGTPVWSHNGIVCTGETYRAVVKMTFAKGAALKDPSRLFNSSLDGNVRRAIDVHEGEKLDVPALKALIRAAVALNASGKTAAPARPGKTAAPARPGKLAAPAKPGKQAASAKPGAHGTPAKPGKQAASAKPGKQAASAKPGKQAASE